MKTIKDKTRSQLTRATIIIALFTLLSRLVGLLRDRALASTFGAGDTLDIYYAAFRLPDFLFNLLILGTFSAAFIPVFTEYLVKDQKQAFRIANTVLNATGIAMLALSGILAVFAPILVAMIVPGFSADKQIVVTDLTRIMLLSPIFFSISSIFSSILNSFKRFTVVAMLPVVYNLAIILGIYFLYPIFGASGLAWGVVLGAFLHMVLQVPSVWRAGFRWQSLWDFQLPGVKKIAKLFVPRIFSMDLGQISFFISAIIGSTLSAGTIAVYNLASNLQAVPIGVIAIAFATAAFPTLSEAAARGDKQTFKEIFTLNLTQIIYLIVPLSALMMVLRAQIVRLILGAGQFGWQDTILTISTLMFFLFSLFAQSLIPLLARSFYSLQNTVTPVITGSIAIIVNILGAIYFSRIYGVAGLALAFSVATVLNFMMLFVLFELKFGNIIDKQLIFKIEKIAASTVLMGIVSYATLYLVEPFVNTHTVLGLLSQASAAASVGILFYLGFSYAINLEESRHLIISGKLWLNKLGKAFSRNPGGI